MNILLKYDAALQVQDRSLMSERPRPTSVPTCLRKQKHNLTCRIFFKVTTEYRSWMKRRDSYSSTIQPPLKRIRHHYLQWRFKPPQLLSFLNFYYYSSSHIVKL